MKREILENLFEANKNIIINGEIAVGKTENVSFALVDKMLNQNESIVIVDSKEEYIKKYYYKLKGKNYNIITINLRDLDKTDGWNPLEYPYKLYKNGNQDRALDYLENIVKVIFRRDDDIDSFWSLSAADFLTGLVLGLFKDAEDNEINFNSLNSMVECAEKKFGNNDYITEYFKSKDNNSAEYIYAQSTFLAPKETKGGILSEVRQKLKTYVGREKLSNLLNKTTFDFEDICNKPTAIFVIAKDEDRKINSIASMFIEQVFQVLIDLKSNNKYNFILDNIDDVDFNFLSEMLSSGIYRKIRFSLITRSLKDLNNKYGYYINNLSNIVDVNIKNICVNIGGEQESFSNNLNNNIVNNVSFINYPNIVKNKINTFDLESFIRKIKVEKFKSIEVDNKYFGETEANKNNSSCDKEVFNTDDLLARIDAKIKELDEQEKIKNKQENNLKTLDKPKKTTNIFASKNSFQDKKVNSNLETGDFDLKKFIEKIDQKIKAIEEQEKLEKQQKDDINKQNKKLTSIFDDKDITTNKSSKSKFNNIDPELQKFIEKIDKRIEEIEKKENIQQNNSISEFEQFKIERISIF